MRRLLQVFLTAAAGVVALAASEEPRDTHPPAGVVVATDSGARLVEASVRGTLLDWAALERQDGGRDLYLLATTEDDPSEQRSLFRAELEPPRLVALTTELPKSFDRLRAIDGEGGSNGSKAPQLLLGRPGGVFLVSGLSEGSFDLVPLARAPGLDLAADLVAHREVVHEEAGHEVAHEETERETDPPATRLNLPSTGMLRRYERGDTGDWRPAGRVPLLTRATRHRHGLRLTTPRSVLLTTAGRETLAVGPEAVGSRRLRSLLVPASGSGEAAEVWSRLPGAERLQWSWFHLIDGKAVLIVTTNSADKLGILERQRLRVFTLYGDRTRAGVGPWLSSRTTSRRWQHVQPFVADIDGDGDDDLVVAQVDGLGSGKTRLEAFVNSGRRSFEPDTRSTTFEKSPGGWHFGDDLTGDGLADFVLLTEGNLQVYPTLGPNSRRLIERRPAWSFAGADIPRVESSVELGTGGVAVTDERPYSAGKPHVVDLDGDGRGELILAENPQWGFGRLRVVFLPPL